MIPNRWQRFWCRNCETQIDIHTKTEGEIGKALCCPRGCPEPLQDIEVSRIAVDLADIIIGSGPASEALLDYAGCIANALVDIRNMMDVKL